MKSGPARPGSRRTSEHDRQVTCARLLRESSIGVQTAQRLQEDFTADLLQAEALPAQEKREPAEQLLHSEQAPASRALRESGDTLR